MEPDWGENLIVSRDFEPGTPTRLSQLQTALFTGIVQSNRVTGAALEPRGSSRATTRTRICSPSGTRRRILIPYGSTSPRRCGCPRPSIRVVQPRVGGAFGLKQPTFQEEPLAAYLPLSSVADQVDRDAGRELPGRRPFTRHALPLRGGVQAGRADHRHPRSRSSPTSARRAPCWLGHVVRDLVLPAHRLRDPERPRCSCSRS